MHSEVARQEFCQLQPTHSDPENKVFNQPIGTYNQGPAKIINNNNNNNSNDIITIIIKMIIMIILLIVMG